jgi:palmitoyltransferase
MHPVAQQVVDFHANALPGITRPEEGEECRRSNDMRRPNGHTAPVQLSYHEMEQQQSRRRYEEYLDEQDSEKLPSAFDLGWKRNMEHLLGPNKFLWLLPINNTTGDGWSWEASPKWLEVRDRLRREREEQRAREISAGWGPVDPHTGPPMPQYGHRAPQTKADRILGREPNVYAETHSHVPMQRLSPRGRTLEQQLQDFDSDGDDDGFADESAAAAAGRVESPADRLRSGQTWTRGGASGMLRKGSSPRSQTPRDSFHDEGVD